MNAAQLRRVNAESFAHYRRGLINLLLDAVVDFLPSPTEVKPLPEVDAEGNEKHTDYKKMLNLVRKAGYKGWVSVEWEGGSLSESEGIKATVKLLERVRQQLD